MKINELQARQTNVDVEGVITEVGDTREFEKFGKKGRVANGKLKDETGEVKLSLWNEQIDQVNVGDRLRIQKGYVGEWQGELQLTTGKFGTLEVLGDEEGTKESVQESPAEKKEEPKPEPAAEPETSSEEVKKTESQSGLDIEEEKIE